MQRMRKVRFFQPDAYFSLDFQTKKANIIRKTLEAKGTTISGEEIDLEPGDALVVYSGREAWQSAHSPGPGYTPPSPGLHASCLPYLRDHDIAVLVWDLMDANPNEYDLPWTVHGAIFAYGVALVDNALLQPLAQACAEEGRYEFMLTLAPLPFIGGTGSPVNPLALL